MNMYELFYGRLTNGLSHNGAPYIYIYYIVIEFQSAWQRVV